MANRDPILVTEKPLNLNNMLNVGDRWVFQVKGPNSVNVLATSSALSEVDEAAIRKAFKYSVDMFFSVSREAGINNFVFTSGGGSYVAIEDEVI